MSTDSASELSYHEGRREEDERPINSPPPTVTSGRATVFTVYDPPEAPNPIGIYGWRKRCLYLFLLLVVIVIVANLGLTVWILVVLDFNVDGMGKLRITDDGLRLEGRAEFIDPLYAQNINSDQDSILQLQSEQTVEITSGTSKLQLGQNTLDITTDSFRVYTEDQDTDPVLSVSNDGVSVTANQLQAVGTLGVFIEGPVETSQIQSSPNQQLKLESPSGNLRLVGSHGVTVETGGIGGVAVTAQDDITLESRNGSIVLEARELSILGLPVSQPTGSGQMWEGVHEVCVCASGTIYLVAADVSEGCQAGGAICDP